ncbi:MAG: 1-acyl-sn-glycerol-3-phosphate acyltransferase [Anaerolineales bacterium]|nr:1-acyl-sn-glycerol-3-phosphate acyltransferase [Anaerolineales bacterium]
MWRAFLRLIIRVISILICRIEVDGLENVPAQGGAILAANHLALVDSPLLFILIERSDLTGLVADKHKKNPFLYPLVSAVKGIWINRESADFHALKAARDFLRAGGLLGIAPEGTRSRTGALMRAKTGVAYLADKADVPIVPIAIVGSEKLMPELLHLRRACLKVRIGKPFRLPALERANRSASLQRNTDEIMCRIAAQLPPAYLGVYADHPRLLELLAADSGQ